MPKSSCKLQNSEEARRDSLDSAIRVPEPHPQTAPTTSSTNIASASTASRHRHYRQHASANRHRSRSSAHRCVCGTLAVTGGREESREGDMEESVKRNGRRITRGRYRMGYMFGKRSDMEDNTADLLIKSLTGKAISVEDLSTALQSDPALADRVAQYMDKNDDGYVAVSELL